MTRRNRHTRDKFEACFGVIQTKIAQTAHGKLFIIVHAGEIAGGKVDSTGECADLTKLRECGICDLCILWSIAHDGVFCGN